VAKLTPQPDSSPALGPVDPFEPEVFGPSVLAARRSRQTLAGRLTPARHPPFLLVWTGGYIATDYGVVADLRMHPLVNGVNAVVQRRDGKYETDDLEFNISRAGHKLILPETAYCREVPGQPGCYAFPWTSFRQGSPVNDDAAAARFAQQLVDAGEVPAPSVEDLKLIRAQLQRQIGNKPDVMQDDRDTLTRRLKMVDDLLGAAGKEE